MSQDTILLIFFQLFKNVKNILNLAIQSQLVTSYSCCTVDIESSFTITLGVPLSFLLDKISYLLCSFIDLLPHFGDTYPLWVS